MLQLGLHEEEPPRALIGAHHLDGPLPVLRGLVDVHARVEQDLDRVGVPLLAAPDRAVDRLEAVVVRRASRVLARAR